MSVDLNRAAMLESNSPRFESLIAQTAAQELWTWTSGPVAGLRRLNSQDPRQCCRRFQHALHTCLGSLTSGKLPANPAHIPPRRLFGNAGPTPFGQNCLRATRET